VMLETDLVQLRHRSRRVGDRDTVHTAGQLAQETRELCFLGRRLGWTTWTTPYQGTSNLATVFHVDLTKDKTMISMRRMSLLQVSSGYTNATPRRNLGNGQDGDRDGIVRQRICVVGIQATRWVDRPYIQSAASDACVASRRAVLYGCSANAHRKLFELTA